MAGATGDPLIPYLDESGDFGVGLPCHDVAGNGACVGVSGLNYASFSFVPNATYPDLQILLDYTPSDFVVENGEGQASIAYEFRVKLIDSTTDETLAVFNFTNPGGRSLVLPVENVDGREYFMDLYLRFGAEVEWNLRVNGWKLPEPV